LNGSGFRGFATQKKKKESSKIESKIIRRKFI
jgi:hypothetical protein